MGDEEKKPEEAPPAEGDDAEKRKAEVKARMAAEAEAAKKKKGFMTPARKSKLRSLLRKKAAEELKKEEERRREERKRVVGERCGEQKSVGEEVPIEGLRAIVQEYHDHICATESSKYDLEMQLVMNDFIISDLTAAVTDLRGRFVKPKLKKVSKFEDKFAALNKKASEFKLKAELSKND